MLIFGASGAGTTTVGKNLVESLNHIHLDAVSIIGKKQGYSHVGPALNLPETFKNAHG